MTRCIKRGRDEATANNNIFCQLQRRDCGETTLAQFRGVPSQFQVPLSQVLPADDLQSVFLCHSRDGLQLISYTCSGTSYRLQIWEAPLWSRDSACDKLYKIVEIPLFASLTDSDLDQDGLELEEEKHLRIGFVQTKCGCCVVTGNFPSSVENSQRVFVTVVSPLAGRMTILHFTYICFGLVSQPTVIPSKRHTNDDSYSFLLVFNAGDSLHVVRVSSVARKEEYDDHVSSGSRFFRKDNWLCDATLRDVETKHLPGVGEGLKYEELSSLELEPVLARWLSQEHSEQEGFSLRDYSAVCVRAPEVEGNMLVAVVLLAKSATRSEMFAVLALTLGFDSQHLGIVKLSWNRATLHKLAAHNMNRQLTTATPLNARSSSSPTTTLSSSPSPSLNDLCVAAASLVSRQRYLPCAKSEYTFCTSNAPVFGCSRSMLVNPCFPVAIVL